MKKHSIIHFYEKPFKEIKLITRKLFQVSILVSFFLYFNSCDSKPDLLERALSEAGKNKIELEKVLLHYKDDPLKLQAAQFLIENMPGHYSYAEKDSIFLYYNEIDSLYEVTKDFSRERKIHLYDSISSKYDTISFKKVPDVQVVSAKYLIDNIDRSFDLWQQGSWAKHVNFEDFCEYILPYKVVDGQALDNWKEYSIEECKGDIDSLYYCSTYKNLAYKACEEVNSVLKKKMQPVISVTNSNIAIRRVNTSMKIVKGICDDYSFIATAVMRAKGIPVSMDYTPQWPDKNLGHSWNVLLDNNKKNIIFLGCDNKPGSPHKVDQKMAKVFRKTFAINKELYDVLQNEKKMPPLLNDWCIKDVTQEYTNTYDVEVEMKHNKKHKFAYLAVFDNKKWTPVYWGKIKGNKAKFERMGANIVYLPVCYENNKVVPLSHPFLLTYSGEKIDIIPNEKEKQPLNLYRKYFYPQQSYNFYKRTIGAKIQVATHADFRDSITLFTIQKPEINTGKIVFDNKKYQYWRYLSPDKANCNIAELYFFEKDSTKAIYGNIIGTDGSYQNNGRVKERAFDKNPLTCFDSPPIAHTWVGMDFGRPVEIEKILYVPRSDGNSIIFENEYELMYWKNGEWVSLGRKTAHSEYLKYKECPGNALFLLHNLTEGAEERIFTYENGEQVWW